MTLMSILPSSSQHSQDLDRAVGNLVDRACLLPSKVAQLVDERLTSCKCEQEAAFLREEVRTWQLLAIQSRCKASGSPCYQQWLEWLLPRKTIDVGTPTRPKRKRMATSSEMRREMSYQFDMDSDEEDAHDHLKDVLRYIDQHHRKIFFMMRQHHWDDLITYTRQTEQPSRALLFEAYARQTQRIADEDVPVDDDVRDTWTMACKRLVEEHRSSEFATAVYGLMLGDLTLVLPVCNSWESVMWAFYHTQMHNGLTDTTLDECLAVADSRDKDGDATRRFFHRIQTWIMDDHLDRLLAGPASIHDDQWHDIFTLHAARRFMALIVLYVRHQSGKDTSKQVDHGDVWIADYAVAFQQPASFQPTLLAIYASHMHHDKQIDVYAQFLHDFDGDADEIELLVELGYRNRLDMSAILRQVFYKSIQDTDEDAAMDEKDEDHAMTGGDGDTTRGHGADGEMIEENESFARVSRFQNALPWLLRSNELFGEVFVASNTLIRELLLQGQLDAVNRVLQMLPAHDDTQAPLEGMDEHIGYVRLMQCHQLYTRWNTLRKQEPTPKDNHDLAGYKQLAKWTTDMMTVTDETESALLDFLRTPWLPADTLPTTTSTDDTANQRNAVRVMYRPTMFTNLLRVYRKTKHITSANVREKKPMLFDLLASTKYDLYQDVLAASSLRSCLVSLCSDKIDG
ncbi:107-domain-containing protein [Gongronella butleri]|nr:107-domain-containing protein [Gongronella butleri]